MDAEAGVPIAVADHRAMGRRRWRYTATTTALSLVMVFAVLDAVDVVNTIGVDERTVSASFDGTELRVRAGSVSRPGLATPFEIDVERPRGFDGAVEIALETDYLEALDVNLVTPTPSAERTFDEWVVYEFDPPIGTRLHVQFDARIEPSVQHTVTGRVGMLDGEAVEHIVEFSTRVLP
jgi:hypothetical protein